MKNAVFFITALCAGFVAVTAGLGEISWGINPTTPTATTLVSAHWAHINTSHALLNAAGWTLAVALLYRQPRAFLAVAVCSAALISCWWAAFGTSVYVGLSGVLYGLFAYAVTAQTIASGHRLAGLIGIAGLALAAGTGLTSSFVNFAIAHEAHLLGGGVGVTAAVSRGSTHHRGAGEPAPQAS